MQKLLLASLFMTIGLQILLTQTPVLVADFNPGEEESFSAHNFNGISYKNKLFFPIFSNSLGQELGMLDGDELSVLKDISKGFWSSKPQNFTKYEGLLYFTAIDEMGSALYRTDGTSGGTQLAFRPPASNPTNKIEGLIVSKEGLLYFTREGKLYAYDNVEFKKIFDGISFDNNYCQYKDGIVFLKQHSNTFRLYEIKGMQIEELGEAGFTGSTKEVFGISPVQRGILYGIADKTNGTIHETFVYDKDEKEVYSLTENIETKKRIKFFDGEKALVWRGGEGYFATDGYKEELLYETNNTTAPFGDDIYSIAKDDKMIFQADKTSIDDFLMHTDGTSLGTKELFDIDYRLSNLLEQENFAFFATGTFNNNFAKVYYLDLNDGSYTNIYTYDVRSESASILLVGVYNGRLYYLSNHDEEVGRELYYLELDVISETEDEELSNYDIELTANSIKIKTEKNESVQLLVYNIAGVLIKQEHAYTNQVISTTDLKGLYVFSFLIGEKVLSKKLFRI